MTLNAIVKRIEGIAGTHAMVKAFGQGNLSDFLAAHTQSYPMVFLQSTGGQIAPRSKEASFSFRLFFLDIVHLSDETKLNELDVQSDQISIAMDFVSLMTNGGYTDWDVSNGSFQLLAEEQSDFLAGCYVDISIRVMYPQNICQVPK